MGAKRVLLMHISNVSGHRCASAAIEKALHQIEPEVKTRTIDAFNYTSPFMEALINWLYMLVIKALPRFWEYLYDNQNVLRRLKKIRSLIHRLNDQKIKKLFAEFRPDVVVCTQAFPCGMIADYKQRHSLSLPLMAVLTDYAPHSYWLDDFVDVYVVPTPKIKQRFISRGVPSERLEVLGIPIDSKFAKQSKSEHVFRRLGLNSNLPVILIMGGGQGLGPIKEIVWTLDKLDQSLQLIVVCGTNRKLYQWLNKKKSLFTKPLCIIGYSEQIDDLMEISAFFVSKPGGLSSAEALSKSLPIIIVRPLPGQESLNTWFLLETGVALRADDLYELRCLAQELLSDSAKLNQLRNKARAFAQPDSALNSAELILRMARDNKT